MKTLTLKKVQQIIKDWTDTKEFKWSAYGEYCHLVEEIGELGEALTVQQGERSAGSGTEGLADHSDMDEEIGDVLFSTLIIANRFGIDMEKCFSRTIERYNKKVEKRLKK